MDSEQLSTLKEHLITFECSVRVMAMSVAISARIEGMKAANFERKESGLALAYDRQSFLEAELEMLDLIRTQIGLS
jgi:hypothetical protein